jgi:exo-beta-1,3-glucanase (GH17 family)
MHTLEAHPMKHSPFGRMSIRAAFAALLAVVLMTACGGGGGIPYTGVTIRPLSPEFTSRKAVAYGAYRTARNAFELDAENIPKANIKQDLDLMLAAGFRMIRLFSSDDKVAKQTLEVIADNNLNMKVQLGAFILGDTYASTADKAVAYAANDRSIAKAVALANNPAFKDIILAVSIGNETQVDFSGVRTNPETLAGYIRTVRSQITQPVTTDDNWLAWARMPAVITNEVDFASIHIYAQLDTFFDPKLFDWRQKDVAEASRAAAMMDAVMVETKRQYGEARKAFDSKGLSYIPITVGETGWNVIDPRLPFRAHPVNQKMYFDRITAWAAEGRNGPGPDAVFYFVAFDEQWKQGDDGWGLFNKDRQARYAIQAINANNSPAGSATWVWAPGTCSDANALYFVPPVVNAAITANKYVLYSDAAPGASEVRPTGLQWDAFDGNTAIGNLTSPNYGPGDAANGLEITPRPASFGWGLLRQPAAGPVDACSRSPVPLNGATDNLSNYAATGMLNFSISTTYPGKIEIGIITDTEDRVGQEAFLQIGPGNYGYCNTGAWCQVSIPLKDFTAKNPKLDLSLVLGRFVISDVYSRTGNAPGSTAKLYIDGINWSK